MKVLKENDVYDWLLLIPNIKKEYIKRYIQEYIKSLIKVDYKVSDFNTESKLSDASVFGKIYDTLDTNSMYQIISNNSDGGMYIDNEYASLNCTFKHIIRLVGDFEYSTYTMGVEILASDKDITDSTIIKLYDSGDKIINNIIISR